MIEAVYGADFLAQRAAHDEPHHELDPFGSRLAHVFEVGHAREGLRCVDQSLDEPLVPGLVDETRPGSLQLVTHSPGAPDLHVEVRVERIDRAANRLAELIAAAPR